MRNFDTSQTLSRQEFWKLRSLLLWAKETRTLKNFDISLPLRNSSQLCHFWSFDIRKSDALELLHLGTLKLGNTLLTPHHHIRAFTELATSLTMYPASSPSPHDPDLQQQLTMVCALFLSIIPETRGRPASHRRAECQRSNLHTSSLFIVIYYTFLSLGRLQMGQIKDTALIFPRFCQT